MVVVVSVAASAGHIMSRLQRVSKKTVSRGSDRMAVVDFSVPATRQKISQQSLAIDY